MCNKNKSHGINIQVIAISILTTAPFSSNLTLFLISALNMYQNSIMVKALMASHAENHVVPLIGKPGEPASL